MIIVVVAVAVLALTPLTGASLRRLGDLRLRHSWLLALALAAQVVLISIVPSGSPGLHRVGHLATYGLACVWLGLNWRVPGLAAAGLGGGLNLAAIAANGGTMPSSATALARAGVAVVPGEFANSAAVAHARLGFLGDVFATPHWLPLHNVFSVGDCLLMAGLAATVHLAGHARHRPFNLTTDEGQTRSVATEPLIMRLRNKLVDPQTVIVGFSWEELDLRPRDVDFEIAELHDRINRLRDEVANWRSRIDG